jgi:hypothetical protein
VITRKFQIKRFTFVNSTVLLLDSAGVESHCREPKEHLSVFCIFLVPIEGVEHQGEAWATNSENMREYERKDVRKYPAPTSPRHFKLEAHCVIQVSLLHLSDFSFPSISSPRQIPG